MNLFYQVGIHTDISLRTGVSPVEVNHFRVAPDSHKQKKLETLLVKFEKVFDVQSHSKQAYSQVRPRCYTLVTVQIIEINLQVCLDLLT